MTKYLNNSIRKNSTGHILNNISNFLICVSLITLILIYLGDMLVDDTEPLNYIELKHSYKNCIIVGKSDKHEQYMLYINNPYIDNNNLIDYKVKVKDYIYFNWFIGDTIK